MITMQPTLIDTVPTGESWQYEVKYDGFRALFYLSREKISLTSRNGRSLDLYFPELLLFASEIINSFDDSLPVMLDGEITALENPNKSNFEYVQQRGRMKNSEMINSAADRRPVVFLAFDLLRLGEEDLSSSPLKMRKQKLKEWGKQHKLPVEPSIDDKKAIQLIPPFENKELIWDHVILNDGEGIVAKKKNSEWKKGKTTDWMKIKNYKTADVFIKSYNPANHYIDVAVIDDHGNSLTVAQLYHGLSADERNAILTIMKQNGTLTGSGTYMIHPSICLTVKYLSYTNGVLREPSFLSFQLKKSYEECTIQQLILSTKSLHPSVKFTNLDKPIFPKKSLNKSDYLTYLMQISDVFLPFLKDRALTVIRYPHGPAGESFYQKNKPEYTPDFIHTAPSNSHDYILCQDYSSLLWLGNQLALEFHVPFQTIDTNNPVEIVFDLDPPSANDFELAIECAIELNRFLLSLGIHSFPKLSGNKGLQLYIPISKDSFSYEETRKFTAFTADYCIASFPHLFTTERLIKNRQNLLYLDYLQHAYGKTIIAPYSPRGNEDGTVALPLYWDEVNSKLSPKDFTMEKTIIRLKNKGCPFGQMRQQPQDQPIAVVLEHLNRS
ncbi:bifunctional non-homologous end joining protein LigD [Bacillus capparidis]|nr:bifunctional non-homologous end joining protein LigD [Bacillus capparidis]